ncbi:AaceriADR318Wp [[Ashbya] aceris (nom. inval.)]|nr:AaceriADR318Wp [[Ashbya] aceris (nom. inval.)]
MGHSIASIASLPVEVKLELLSCAPILRHVSREWYRLHDALYAMKCARIDDYRLMKEHLERHRELVERGFEELEPLRLLCRQARAQAPAGRVESIEERTVGAWYWIYYTLFIYPLVPNISEPVEVITCASTSHISIWVELVQRQPGLRPTFALQVDARYARGASQDDEGSQDVLHFEMRYTVDSFVAERMTEPGYYCLSLPELPLSDPRQHPLQLRLAGRVMGTGSTALRLLALDFAPYQKQKQWVMFRASGRAYDALVRRRTGSCALEHSDDTEREGIANPKREFVFRFPRDEPLNEHLDWTAPYLG